MGKMQFTAAYWHEIEDKLMVYKRLKPLADSLDMSNFTGVFNELLVVFQCFPPDTKSRKVKEYKVMRRKTPTLELYLVLDYDKVIQGTDAENLAYMKEVLLKGCEKFLKPLKGFEWEPFETALRQRLF